MRNATNISSSEDGVSLLELAIVVSILSVMAAVFFPTFLREMQRSKTGEASEQLAELFRLTQSYMSSPKRDKSGVNRIGCLPESAGPTPSKLAKKRRYVNFSHKHVLGRATWIALHFQPDSPIHYQYRFIPTAPGCNQENTPNMPALLLRAEGDLDQDGNLATVERSAATNRRGELIPLGILHTKNRAE